MPENFDYGYAASTFSEEVKHVHVSHRVYTENLFLEGISKNYVPIKSFSYAGFSGVINPSQPLWFDFYIHSLLETSSRDK